MPNETKPKNNTIFIITLILLIIVIITLIIALVLSLTKNSRTTTTSVTSTTTPVVTTTIQNTTAVTITPTSSTTQTPIQSQTKVKVYFSNKTMDETIVYALERSSNRVDIATFVMEEFIKGPTSEESSKGYVSDIKLSGASNCNNKDFSINIVNKKATIQFCRDVLLAGIGSDAKLSKEIHSNLEQFSTVNSTVMLNKNGKCLIDYSGLNQCGQ